MTNEQPLPESDKPQTPDTTETPDAAEALTPTPPPPPDRPAEPAPPRAPKTAAGQWWWGVGRRKSAVARVRIRPGEGKFVVNNRPYDKYLTEERDQKDLMGVLTKTRTAGSMDVYANVRGGGFTGQAGAILLGLGRALRKYDMSLDPILREHGFLSRDPRKVERKKYGQPGARKRFQFSKR